MAAWVCVIVVSMMLCVRLRVFVRGSLYVCVRACVRGGHFPSNGMGQLILMFQSMGEPYCIKGTVVFHLFPNE